MASIGSLGAGSGLDLTSLLDKLMSAEALPLTKLQTKEAGVQAQISAFGQLNSSLSALRDASTSLTAAKFNGLTANSGDKAIATATATTGASAGSFSLEVVKLAVAEKAVSAAMTDSAAKLRAGSLSFTFGSVVEGVFQAAEGEPKTVSIAEGKNSLADVRDAINSAGVGVTATLVNDGSGTRLIFTADQTGAENTFKIEGIDTGAEGASLATLAYDPSSSPAYDASSPASGVSRLQAADDAQFRIDGLAFTSPGNSVEQAFSGVKFNLAKVGTTVVGISKDSASAKTAVQALITTFNSFLASATSLTSNSAGTTRGETNAANGPLAGDSLVREILGKIRDEVFRPVDGATGDYSSLSSLGVTFGKDGKLSLDGERFDAAMAKDPAGVAHLFEIEPNGAGSQGIGARFATVLGSIVDSNGAISSRVGGLKLNVTSLQSQETALTRRLTQIEARYRQQFTALDTMLTSMSNTSTFLTQQINALASLR